MDEIYRTPKSDVLSNECSKARRWNFKKAWELVSKRLLLFVVVLNFIQLWLMSYFDMIDYIQKQGDDPDRLGRSNIFFYMFDFGLVLGSLSTSLVLGLIPFLVVSYKPSNKAGFIAQSVWVSLVFFLAVALWLKPF